MAKSTGGLIEIELGHESVLLLAEAAHELADRLCKRGSPDAHGLQEFFDQVVEEVEGKARVTITYPVEKGDLLRRAADFWAQSPYLGPLEREVLDDISGRISYQIDKSREQLTARAWRLRQRLARLKPKAA